MKKLKVGDKLPTFSGIDQFGNTHQSSDYEGTKLVVYFYPKDLTPGCTMQACSIRDNYEALLNAGYTIFGVSADTVALHARFTEKKLLPFTLLADVDKKIINEFGVWGPKKFMGREYNGIHRTTFVSNEKGIITAIITKPKTKIHAQEILELEKK